MDSYIKNKLQLNSGDLIVFGGVQREMKHAVTSIIKGSFTKIENFDVRINMTFRTCTGFTEEDESQYQTDVYVKRLKESYNKN